MKEIISKKQLTEFGLLMGFSIPLLIGWFIPLIGGHTFRFWTLFIGIPFLLLGIIKPSLLYFPYKTWMKIGTILSFINSYLILGLVFLLVLQPISFLMKCIWYDPLRQNNKNIQKSYKEYKLNHKIDLKRIF